MIVHSSGGIRYYTSDDTAGEPYSEGANCPRPDSKSGDLDIDGEETPPPKVAKPWHLSCENTEACVRWPLELL